MKRTSTIEREEKKAVKFLFYLYCCAIIMKKSTIRLVLEKREKKINLMNHLSATIPNDYVLENITS